MIGTRTRNRPHTAKAVLPAFGPLYSGLPLPTALGRVKSVDVDLSMSGEDIGSADGIVQSYAGTRPEAAGRLAEMLAAKPT